ncbi:MAG: hypothetical protein S0880_21725 [Actinomycetota bacterium]|nr:hypothetical protein [Actinomycetota bacterium]
MKTFDRDVRDVPTATMTTEAPTATRRRHGLVLGLVAVLALVLGVAGGWLLLGSSDDDPSAIRMGSGDLTARQEQLVDVAEAYNAAWHTGDPADVLALAPNGRFEIHQGGSAGTVVFTAADGTLANYVESGGTWDEMSAPGQMIVADDLVVSPFVFDGVERVSVFHFTSGDDPVILLHEVLP